MKFLVYSTLLLSFGVQALSRLDSSLATAEATIENFHTVLSGELPKHNELVVKLEALNPRVNADINKVDNSIVIQVMGGMIQHKQMTSETLLLLLCHEIGHYLGGPPLKSRNGWSSTEGQSDYYSGLRCARILGLDEASFMDGALRLTTIYAEVARELKPRLEQCDEKKVERTNYGYPNAQCRLDTLMAGWSGGERPRCWFNE